MFRLPKLLLVSLLLMIALTASAAAGGRPPVPDKSNDVLTNQSAAQLLGNVERLKQELAAHSSIRYRILIVDNAGNESMTDYLDRVSAQWQEPGPDTLLLVLFAEENWDIRFYMGANFRQLGGSVDEMLGLLHTYYFPLSQKGNVAGGLARLVAAVNDRFSESMQFPVVDKQVSVEARKAITRWANRYLTGLFRVPDSDPLKLKAVSLQELRVDANTENPLYKVVFDVQPASPSSPWMAGSGTLGLDGWVHGKVKLVRVVHENDDYTVVSAGP